MEVHHHESHHGKKNWKTYIWEFLMLFLAVFCGFLAEYQLEHKIDKDKEVTYMQNLQEDLKKDTVSINTMVTGNRLILKGLDTLLDLLSNPQKDVNYQRRLFICSIRYTYYYMPIQFSELTLSQLKYSGNFRLIRNHEVASRILQYEQGVDACKYNYDLLLNYFHIYEATEKDLFNMALARNAYKAIEKDFNTVFLPTSEFEKLVGDGKYVDKDDPALYSKYLEDILFYQTTLSNLTNVVANQKSSALALSQLIHDKYHTAD